jgi:glycosyltransferase involved in cell wall biosynthesis
MGEAPLSAVQVIGCGVRGGSHAVAASLTSELRGLGVACSVLLLADGPIVEDFDRLGVPHRVVPCTLRSPLSGILRLWRFFSLRQPAVVHTHAPRAMFLANLAARLAGVPLVVTTFHELSSVRATHKRWHRLYDRVEGLLSRLCTDCCVAFSDGMRADAIATRGVPPGKLRRIYNGVDPGRFRQVTDPVERRRIRQRRGIAQDDLVIGAVGRLISAKGHRHLVTALASILPVEPRAKLVIAGGGPLRRALEEQAQREGVARAVRFVGDTAEVSELYACFDLFCYPSTHGAFGLVVLEAMACGLPVIASQLTGTTELISDGRTGILVPPGDPAALAAAILGLLADPARREFLAASGRESVTTRFTARGCAREHLEMYRSAFARRGFSWKGAEHEPA